MKRQQVGPEIEVRGEVVLSVVDVMRAFRSVALRVLEKNGIVDPQPDAWYSLAAWLSSFDTIVQEVGPTTLYQIGRQIASGSEIPPEIDTLPKALAHLDDEYWSQHRGGDIGHYHVFETSERSATIVASTPYPSEFDRGVISALAERFEPNGLVDVQLDPRAETRQKGGDSCTFLMRW